MGLGNFSHCYPFNFIAVGIIMNLDILLKSERKSIIQTCENIKGQIKDKLSEHQMKIKDVINWSLDDDRVKMGFKDYSGLFVDIKGINEFLLIENFFNTIIRELINEKESD